MCVRVCMRVCVCACVCVLQLLASKKQFSIYELWPKHAESWYHLVACELVKQGIRKVAKKVLTGLIFDLFF